MKFNYIPILSRDFYYRISISQSNLFTYIKLRSESKEVGIIKSWLNIRISQANKAYRRNFDFSCLSIRISRCVRNQTLPQSIYVFICIGSFCFNCPVKGTPTGCDNCIATWHDSKALERADGMTREGSRCCDTIVSVPRGRSRERILLDKELRYIFRKSTRALYSKVYVKSWESDASRAPFSPSFI